MARRPVPMKNTMLFGGFDLSLTGTGIVVINQNGNVVFCDTLKNDLRGAERLAYLQGKVAQVVNKYTPILICIEDYSMRSTGQLASIGELAGIIKLLLYRRGVGVQKVAPNQLKKYATGKGVGEKSTIMMHVLKNWNIVSKNDNEADAFVLAQIARGMHLPNTVKTKPQREVIRVLKNPPVKKTKTKKSLEE